MAAPTTTITATIARTNERGVQIQERPGEWLNISKYAEPMPVMPMAGTVCRLTIDGAGFVRRIDALDAPPSAPEPRQNGQSAPPDRERLIVRQTCLKAAAEFLAGRPDAKSADVLTVAASWEAWATR